MNCTVFVFVLVVSLGAFFGDIQSAPNVELVPKICTAITNKPAAGTTVWNILYDKLNQDQISQKYENTVAYVKIESNKQAFLAGGTSCENFFRGLRDQFQSDLPANEQTAQDVRQQFIQLFQDQIDKIRKALA